MSRTPSPDGSSAPPLPATPPAYPITGRNRVRQIARRGSYDRAAVYAVLDAGMVAHVAFLDGGAPCVIPMTYGREGDRLYLHGSRTSRIATATRDRAVSIAVTLIDGIVVGSSLFDTSMNYRAAVLFGRARWLDDAAARTRALRCVSEHILPGRWAEVRAPSANEIKATAVLAVDIEAASAKVRTGPPADDAPDRGVWTGVVPSALRFGDPVRAEACDAELALPSSLRRFASPHRPSAREERHVDLS